MSIDDIKPNIDEVGRMLIEKAKEVIERSKTTLDGSKMIDEVMNELYNHFKNYSERELKKLPLQLELFRVECLLKDLYLDIDSTPIFEEKNNNLSTSEEIMDYIVYLTRKELSKKHDLKNESLAKMCPGVSSYLERVCSKMGIEFVHIWVNKDLSLGMYHNFTIVRIKNEDGTYKNYLADCTYRQFFTRNNSNPRRLEVMRGPASGCSIGSFMLLNERRKKIAETILKKGYIELTSEVFKEYFAAIIYSGRTKEFYESKKLDYMNPNDVIPSFSTIDYLETLLHNSVIDESTFDSLSSELLNNDEKIIL